MATVIVGILVALLFLNGIRVHLKMMRRGKQAQEGEEALRLDLQRFGVPAEIADADQNKAAQKEQK